MALSMIAVRWWSATIRLLTLANAASTCAAGMTIEIVFHHDGGVGCAARQLFQRLIERTAADHRQAHAVGCARRR